MCPGYLLLYAIWGPSRAQNRQASVCSHFPNLDVCTWITAIQFYVKQSPSLILCPTSQAEASWQEKKINYGKNPCTPREGVENFWFKCHLVEDRALSDNFTIVWYLRMGLLCGNYAAFAVYVKCSDLTMAPSSNHAWWRSSPTAP